jgi:hypothetical protein
VSAAHSTGMPKTRCLENSPEDFKPLNTGRAAVFNQGGASWVLMFTDDVFELNIMPGQDSSIAVGFKEEFRQALKKELNGE